MRFYNITDSPSESLIYNVFMKQFQLGLSYIYFILGFISPKCIAKFHNKEVKLPVRCALILSSVLPTAVS
jgi:hypothetical protein